VNRVALYARVSSEIQEKEATIESQVALLREAALKQGDIIVDEYRDDGFSGDLLARPGLDKLRDDAAQKLFDRVLILSPDRLTRKWVNGPLIADELRKHGITIQYLNQKDDGTEESKLLLDITGRFAQYEKAKMLERIRRGRLHCARSGRVMTSKPPYGYDYILKSAKAAGHLLINQAKAEVVRLIFDFYVSGMPVTDIAAELRRREIKSPIGNTLWARSMIMKLLRSETYAGVWHYNKKVAEPPRTIRKPHAIRRRVNTAQHVRPRDQWVAVEIPAIVSRETFEAAQAQLARARQFCRRKMHREYLMVGLIRCGLCKRAVCGSPNNGYTYYRCSRNYRFAGLPVACNSKALNSKRADALMWASLRRALENPRVMAVNITGVRQHLATDSQAARNAREQAARQIEQVKQAEGRVLDAYSGGAIGLDQLRDQMAKLKAKREALAAQAAEAEKAPRVPSLDLATVEDLCRKVSRGLDILETDFVKRQRFVRSVVDSVVVEPGRMRVIGALSLPASEPQELHRSQDATSLQQRGHSPIIHFELAVAI
jgi:site-specific DNA recombinase